MTTSRKTTNVSGGSDMKYRKKPVVVEAIQFTGTNYEKIKEFIGQNTLCSTLSIVIPTLEGDYIIKGIAGEFYPCKPDVFEQTYEST
ncbi:unknown phage protein [Streptococcus pyogenes MGAS10394]|nr:unknown phage protein [Streptococcus pyogenes MGAS10394]